MEKIEKKQTKNKQTTTTKPQANNNNDNKHKERFFSFFSLDVITFQIVLYNAFGEINLYNLAGRQKNQLFQIYLIFLMSGLKILHTTVMI